MAELQMRMRQYDKAEKTVIQAMEKIKGDDNSSLASLIMQAQLLKLLAKVRIVLSMLIPDVLCSCLLNIIKPLGSTFSLAAGWQTVSQFACYFYGFPYAVSRAQIS